MRYEFLIIAASVFFISGALADAVKQEHLQEKSNFSEQIREVGIGITDASPRSEYLKIAQSDGIVEKEANAPIDCWC